MQRKSRPKAADRRESICQTWRGLPRCGTACGDTHRAACASLEMIGSFRKRRKLRRFSVSGRFSHVWNVRAPNRLLTSSLIISSIEGHSFWLVIVLSRVTNRLNAKKRKQFQVNGANHKPDCQTRKKRGQGPLEDSGKRARSRPRITLLLTRGKVKDRIPVSRSNKGAVSLSASSDVSHLAQRNRLARCLCRQTSCDRRQAPSLPPYEMHV